MAEQYDWLMLSLVPITGFIAGFINTLAGSGSLITLPVLIVLGLPANVANGTNRVGILIQNIVAVSTFWRHGRLKGQRPAPLIVPSVIGAIIGAQLAVNLDETLLRRTIAGLMIFMLFLVIIRPRRWLEAHDGEPGLAYPWRFVIFLAIGAYGGFIQAGVGFFLLAGLVLGAGYSLVGSNAVKNLIVLFFTIAALAVFVWNDQVRWGLGLLLAAGNAGGAWVAARMAIARGAPFVRWMLIVILTLASIRMLFESF
ncbi:MAG: sulfite exporter TauE/SafE family protein [Gammaproteobacteria bacterium]